MYGFIVLILKLIRLWNFKGDKVQMALSTIGNVNALLTCGNVNALLTCGK